VHAPHEQLEDAAGGDDSNLPSVLHSGVNQFLARFAR
jgi:hypothetical protein